MRYFLMNPTRRLEAEVAFALLFGGVLLWAVW